MWKCWMGPSRITYLMPGVKGTVFILQGLLCCSTTPILTNIFRIVHPFIDLKNQKNKNHLNIDMLHIKWKHRYKENMSRQVWGHMNDLSLIDLCICLMYIKRVSYVTTFFSVLDHMTTHDHYLTSNDLFWLFHLKNS